MIKKSAFILLAAVMTAALLGCANSLAASLTDDEIDALADERLAAPDLPPADKPADAICTDFTGRGLLRVCYIRQADVRHKLQVLCGGRHIVYNLKADGSIEDFSLQFGSGSYTVRILQNQSGSSYTETLSKTFTVSLESETAPFLNAVQNVHWSYDMRAVRAARRIIAPALQSASDGDLPRDCAGLLYRYVCDHIRYDNGKTESAGYDYLPDIDQTFEDETGICYDYSSLLAAMLRSVGIPAKLVKGYALYNPGMYHAWNEVYLDGVWLVIDATLDASTGDCGAMFKDAADYTKVSEY